jgi:hypothetical protein
MADLKKPAVSKNRPYNYFSKCWSADYYCVLRTFKTCGLNDILNTVFPAFAVKESIFVSNNPFRILFTGKPCFLLGEFRIILTACIPVIAIRRKQS